MLTFVCLMHNETKQTETLVLGAEKGLLQGHAADRQVVQARRSLELPFWQSTFKNQVRLGVGVSGFVISLCTIL